MGSVMQPARLVGDFSPDQQARLARQADDAILGRSLPAYAAYFALGLIFVLGFGYHREHPQLAATFLVVILVIAVARVGLHYRGGPLRDRDPKRWRLTFGAGVFLSIATWTVFLCYVIASAGAHRQSFFLLLCY